MKIVYTILIVLGLALAAQATQAAPPAASPRLESTAPVGAEDPAPPKTEALSPEDEAAANPVGAALSVASDLKAKKWREGMAGIIFLLMAAFAKYRKKIPWVGTDRGGALTTIALGVLGSLAVALNFPGPITAMTILGSLTLGMTAAGFFNIVSKLLWPDDSDKQYLLWLKKIVKPADPVAPPEVVEPEQV